MQMPDITTAQIVSLVTAILAVAVAFGAPISDVQSAAIIGLAGTLGSFLVLADAVIRNGRSRALANPEAMRELERPASGSFNK